MVAPTQWAQPEFSLWTHAELRAALSRLNEQRFEDQEFCFFIDGLDEYSGDLEELIFVINDMLAANIRLCVASRSWNIFEAAWGTNDFKLALHDHTKKDIHIFIKKELSDLNQFKELKAFDKRYHNLVSEIIEKANGVFLWVFLVVRSLRRGLVNGGTISDFQRRLYTIPTEMEAFLRQIQENTEKVYLGQASQIYHMCLAAAESLSLTTLAFFGELEEDEDYAFLLPISEVDKQFLFGKNVQARKRIMARCQGLIEFTGAKAELINEFKVNFIHRTVRDVLLTSDINAILKEWSGPFRVRDRLSNLLLLNLKIAPKRFNNTAALC